MAFSSKGIAVELIKRLASLSYAGFQNYCRNILSQVLPNTEATKEMKKLDALGIDLFLLNNDNNEIAIAFQCKGFEVSHFKEAQINQCIDSIKSLGKITAPVYEYYLLVNRVIYKEEREILEAELEKIKAKGFVKQCAVLDTHGIIEYLYKQIKKNFEVAITKSNLKLQSEYKEKLNQRFYYTNVPFELNEKEKKSNPSNFLRNGFVVLAEHKQNDPAHEEPSKYFFVIGDFGFGKTSLLFESLSGLKDYHALYLPLSYFKQKHFESKLAFAMVINELITGEENDMRDLFVKFKAKVLDNILYSNPRVILLFDGMDENIFLGTADGLKTLFKYLNEVKAKCVFSMRKSFWDERQGNFTFAIPKRRIYKDRIKLLEWENDQILEYIENYKNNFQLNDLQYKNLTDFSELIRKNQYGHFYGDIPKRPLFLEMIIQDVTDENIKEIFLSELYEKYFLHKFVWDGDRRFDDIPAGRPVTFTDDIYKGFSNMCTLMEVIAGKLIVYSGNFDFYLEATLEEKEIEQELKEYKIESLNALLLNSVLTSASSRTILGIQIGFAHRSFQEYFTARYIYKLIIKDYEEARKYLSGGIAGTVSSFLINYIEWKMDKTKELTQETHWKILQEDWPANSLGSLVTIPFLKNYPS